LRLPESTVREAYAFFQQHREDTLIVVLGDHETGGMGMDAMGYKLNMAALLNTQVSVEDTLAYVEGQ